MMMVMMVMMVMMMMMMMMMMMKESPEKQLGLAPAPESCSGMECGARDR